jgi:hypothetical protein
LFTNVDLFTVIFSIFVGKGIGHTTIAQESQANKTIFFTASSSILCSKDFITILILLVVFFADIINI